MVRDTNAIEPTSTDQLLAEVSQYWANYRGSVLWDVMDAFNQPMTDISKSVKQIGEWREINNARGAALDMIGQDHQAYRTSDNDNFYRFLIFIKSMLAGSQGTDPSILAIAKTALQKKQGFKIYQTETRHFVLKIPYSEIEDVKTEKMLLSNLKQLAAMGTWMDRVDFDAKTDATDYFGATTLSSEYVRLVAD